MTTRLIHSLALMAVLAMLTACGGDSSSSSSGSSNEGQSMTVTGTASASAPSGMVATLRDPEPLRHLHFLLSHFYSVLL